MIHIATANITLNVPPALADQIVAVLTSNQEDIMGALESLQDLAEANAQHDQELHDAVVRVAEDFDTLNGTVTTLTEQVAALTAAVAEGNTAKAELEALSQKVTDTAESIAADLRSGSDTLRALDPIPGNPAPPTP